MEFGSPAGLFFCLQMRRHQEAQFKCTSLVGKCAEQDDPNHPSEAGIEAIAESAAAEDGNANIVASWKADKRSQSEFSVEGACPALRNREPIELVTNSSCCAGEGKSDLTNGIFVTAPTILARV